MQERGWKHDDSLIGILKRLEAFDLISTKAIENKSIILTEEGEEVARRGSPEARYSSPHFSCFAELVKSIQWSATRRHP